MIFVIFLVVLCNILCDSAPLKENKVKIKFPRPIMHASSVTISGTLNINAFTLRATITGRELNEEEECVIDIRPQNDTILISGTNVTYQFLYGEKDIVPFTIAITAWSNQEENTDSLHVEFNGNNAGMQALEIDNPCSFKSFSAVDRILFEGFKHIGSLTFLYKDEDEVDVEFFG